MLRCFLVGNNAHVPDVRVVQYCLITDHMRMVFYGTLVEQVRCLTLTVMKQDVYLTVRLNFQELMVMLRFVKVLALPAATDMAVFHEIPKWELWEYVYQG